MYYNEETQLVRELWRTLLSKKSKKKKDLSNIFFELIRLKNVKKKLKKFFILFRKQKKTFRRKFPRPNNFLL